MSERYLHAHSQFLYSTDPSHGMNMEPAAVSEEEQIAFTKRSREFFEIMRADELAKAETRSRCNRLRTLEIEARRKSVDPTRALSQIERGMAMLEQMVRGTLSAA